MKNVINRTLAVKKNSCIYKSVSTCLRIASAMRPFLLLPVLIAALFCVNEKAWGGNVVFNAPASASPTEGGSVSVTPSNQQTVWSAGIPFTSLYYEVEATFTYSASANTTAGYVFKGWSTSSTSNSGDTSSSFNKTYKQKGKAGTVTYNADEYYAIFARLTASSTDEMEFGTKLIGAGWSEGTTKSVTIDYVHAGKITATITGTNKTEFSLSNSSSSQSTTVVSNNTNSETNSIITVYFNPSSEGSKSAKLTISSNNNLTSIEINLSGTGQATVNPEYTWDSNAPVVYHVGDASINLANIWTSTSPATRTYTIKPGTWSATGNNNTGATPPAISGSTLSFGQAGTLTIVVSQPATTGYFKGSDEKTITINKIDNTLTVVGTQTKKVEETVGNVYSNKNSDAAVTTYSTASNVTNDVAQTIAYFDVNANTIRIPNSGNVSFNEKAVTIHVCQAENYKYKGVDKTVVVNVQKYDNALKTSFSDINSWSKTIGYGAEATVRVESNHTQTAINVTHKTGGNYSTYNNSTKKVIAGWNPGTDTWEFTQAESYKYKAATAKTMTVEVKALPQTCYLFERSSSSEASKVGQINLNGVGETLTFEIDNQGLGYKATLSTYNGSSWTDEEVSAEALSDYVTRTKSLSDNITAIKFGKKGTDDPYIRNIYVTRKTWLTVPNLDIRTQADGSTLIYPATEGKGTLRIDYSISNGGVLKLYCDNDKFTFTTNKSNATTSPITISGDVDCKSGVLEIPVYYNTDVADVIETAHVVVYNSAFRATPTVTGKMVKRNQKITWKANFDKMSLYAIEDEAATTNVENLTVTYSSDDESIIRVTNEGTRLEAVGEGKTNIYAHTDATAEYNEGHSEKEIEVTPDLVQYIVWNQSLMNMMIGGSKNLNAYATSDIECTTNQNRPITYTSLDPTIASVSGNVLTAHKKGTTTILARQAGGTDTDGHKYVEASYVKTVVVRDPNEPCTADPIFTQGEQKDLFSMELSKPQQDYDIDLTSLDGKPGYLSFACYGENYVVPIIGKKHYSGKLIVAKKIKNNAGNYVWTDVMDLGQPAVDQDNNYSGIAIDTAAIALRIYRPEGGEGHHKIHDAQITLARYMKGTAPAAFQAKVGETQSKTMTLEYSNIVGPITISMLGGANSSFSVDKGMKEPIDGECGAKGSVVLTVSYNPQNPNEAEYETMRVTDGTTTVDFALSGVASVTERNIVWEQGNAQGVATAYTVETPELTARTEDAFHDVLGSVYYGVNDNNTAGASVAGNVLSFTSAGQVFVTAYPTQDTRYSTPSSVTKRFDVAITPTTISTLPVLSAVTSGTAVEDVELTGWQVTNTVNGGVVEGTLAITSADLINVGTNTVTLTFTPDTTDMYLGCTGTTTIVVNKAASVATPSAANIVYGQKVSASRLSNEGTAGTWSWTDEKADNVLDAGTYNDLAVHFTPTSGNYTELDGTVSLTVEKATPVVTAQASAITYGQAISASELSTATGNISGTWAWAVDEEQVLSVGDHVLKANFTSSNANYNDLSNVNVTLTVNKIEELEVPVALSFCAGESVNFHGNTYSEVGEYQVEAEGEIRDTVYNVTVTKLQPTTGTDSKTITVGANESWNGNDLSGYAIGSHEVVFHTENVAGCDSTVTLSLTVVPATNVFTNAEGDGDWGNANNWESGIVPTSDPDIIVIGALEIEGDITVGDLTIENTGSITVITGGTLTVNGESEYRSEYGDIHVLNDGELALGNSADLKVRNFTLDAKLGDSKTPAASGQVSGDEKLMVNGDAYFDMAFDPSNKISFGWYDFVVPFEVEVVGGISRINSDDDRVLTSGVDFLIQEYSEARRASNLKSWTNFSGTLQPGRVYTITFNYRANFDQNEFRFKKKANAAIGASDTFNAAYTESGSGSNYDKGWNGLGNGMLKHAQLHGIEDNNVKVQIYNHATNTYVGRQANNVTFAVGTSFFMQVEAQQDIKMDTAQATTQKPLLAPSRTRRSVDEFHLSMMNEDATEVMDNLWVSASEDATGEYVIGHDLLKMGTPTSAKVAQMWTENNGLKLCDIEMPLVNDNATCALGLFAPTAGSYWFAIDEAPDDATLYLTQNGNIVWDLTISPYLFDLSQGTTEGYGLRIETKKAPAITTDIEQSETSGQSSVRKVLIDNKVYIVTPDGKMYDVIGKGIKF